MTEKAHHDTSHAWLIFFMVCFAITVLGIGVWALCCYDVNKKPAAPTGGHGMILPMDGDYAPHAAKLPVA